MHYGEMPIPVIVSTYTKVVQYYLLTQWYHGTSYVQSEMPLDAGLSDQFNEKEIKNQDRVVLTSQGVTIY